VQEEGGEKIQVLRSEKKQVDVACRGLRKNAQPVMSQNDGKGKGLTEKRKKKSTG